MDKLEELYFIAFNCNCFEEAYKRGVYDWLGNLQQTLTWENDNIDSTLLALTVVQKLYQRLETVHCPYLKIITDDLVSKSYLVDILIKYLDHRNQHVVFSATKAIVVVFQTLPKQMIKEEWLQTLFNFGKEVGQPWKKLYTMELLSKILKNCREAQKNKNENSQQHINNKKSSCTHEAGSLVGTTASSTELVELFLGSFNMQHILFHFIPFIVRPNGMYSFLRSCEHIGPAVDFVVLQASLKLGDAIHDQENVKREAFARTKESNLVAYLHCVALVAKYLEVNRSLQNSSTADVKTCSQNETYFLKPQESESINLYGKNTAELCEGKTGSIHASDMAIAHTKDATVNQLCTVIATLIQYLHYPRLPSQIFKKILEVLNQIVVIPSSLMFTKKSKDAKLEKIVRISSISFLSVVECCLLHKIPQCSGFVGFSGTEIKSSLKSTYNEHSVIDLVALRKASLMVFKSSFVALKSAMKQEGTGSLLFHKLSLSCISLWCSGILSLAPDGLSDNKSTKASSNESDFHNCLVTLFLDQDDHLLEAMLLLLLLYQEIDSCNEVSAIILHQLNPHLLFIAFAESIEFDHSLLLDLLISSETRFLEYLVQYLHFVIDGWNSFVQCLVEYQGKISCSDKEATSDELSTWSPRVRELEADSNSVEKPTEFEGSFSNEIRPRKNDPLFAEQGKVVTEEEVCLETLKQGVSHGTMLKPGQEVCQPDFRLLGNLSSEQYGLTSIGLAYCSSDESDVEIEEENESANYHITPAGTRPDCISCSSVCFKNNNLPDISGIPREHSDPAFLEHCTPDLNADSFLGHDQSCSSGAKVYSSESKRTTACITKGSRIKGSVDDPTVLGCEMLDKVMTMLIRLRMSVVRLSSGGHFPYSAAPLITLMENVEKCYDGC